jgi:hypothetical protein
VRTNQQLKTIGSGPDGREVFLVRFLWGQVRIEKRLHLLLVGGTPVYDMTGRITAAGSRLRESPPSGGVGRCTLRAQAAGVDGFNQVSILTPTFEANPTPSLPSPPLLRNW